MEAQERKILVEVSQEEYEKIKAGILEKDIPTYEDVKKDFIEKMSEEDIKALLEEHSYSILKSFMDETLIEEIIRRTKRHYPSSVQVLSYREEMNAQDCFVIKGALNGLNYSQFENPVEISGDVFSWSMKR